MLNDFTVRPQTESVVTTITNKRTAVAIRYAVTEADVQAINELCRRGFSKAHNQALAQTDMTHYLMNTFNTQQVIAEMIQGHMRFLVAEVDDQIVGTVRLGRVNPPHPILLPTPLELSRLYLRPQWVGRGIGAALMQHTLDTAMTVGFETCWLTVWEGNDRAIKFYRQWGFQPIGTETLRVGRSAPHGMVMYRLI